MARHFHYTLPFGSEILDAARTRFRLWAPDLVEVNLHVDGLSPIAMQALTDGWFECDVCCGADTNYQYAIDGDTRAPDPASRQQHGDVDAPSVVGNPRNFLWQCDTWGGRPWREMVIYELHVGCLGGFEGVERQLQGLVDLGITAIELMPIADFSGKRNWGYDGVLPFAPDASYGTPQQLKHLIDSAHKLGICVFLDVVYNHFGPEGNYLHRYASTFFDSRRSSPWGAAIDFSKPQVRDFFTHNALYWLLEFRFDGLRIDAAHQISDPGWLDEMAAVVRARVEPERHIHLMLENEHNQASHLRAGFNAQWNDDAHNVLHVLLTGETTAYYENYREQPAQKLARCLAEGFVFQGEPSPTHAGRPRGTPSADLPPHAFIFFLQNHDQIGNRAFGERLTVLCSENKLRAAITLQLLTPQIPLLFMGEEWGSCSPFLFFTDFRAELATQVREGRRREFAAQPAFGQSVFGQSPSELSSSEHPPSEHSPSDQSAQSGRIPDPNALSTYTASIPDQDEKNEPAHVRYLTLYRQLLALRKQHISPALDSCRSLGANTLGCAAVLARWQLDVSTELIIGINLGPDCVSMPPLAATLLFCSNAADLPTSMATSSLPAQSTSVFLRRAEIPS